MQLFAGRAGEIQQRIRLGDAHAHGAFGDLHNLVAATHFSLLQYAEVKARSMMRHQQRGHARLVHANAHAVAGHTRLGHFEERAAHLVAIANEYFVVGQPIHGKVLAKLAPDEIVAPQFLLPIAIRADLVDEDGTMFASVPGEIALSVTDNVQLADDTPAFHRAFPNRSANRLAFPGDIARESYIDRQQPGHVLLRNKVATTRRELKAVKFFRRLTPALADALDVSWHGLGSETKV